MSCRRLKVSGTLVSTLLLHINGPYRSDLPEDVQVRDIEWDDQDKLFILLLESNVWPPVAEGMVFPFIEPTFSLVDGPQGTTEPDGVNTEKEKA